MTRSYQHCYIVSHTYVIYMFMWHLHPHLFPVLNKRVKLSCEWSCRPFFQGLYLVGKKEKKSVFDVAFLMLLLALRIAPLSHKNGWSNVHFQCSFSSSLEGLIWVLVHLYNCGIGIALNAFYVRCGRKKLLQLPLGNVWGKLSLSLISLCVLRNGCERGTFAQLANTAVCVF